MELCTRNRLYLECTFYKVHSDPQHFKVIYCDIVTFVDIYLTQYIHQIEFDNYIPLQINKILKTLNFTRIISKYNSP